MHMADALLSHGTDGNMWAASAGAAIRGGETISSDENFRFSADQMEGI